MPFFAGDPPTAATENPPGPDPDEPPVPGGGNTYYLSTTGDDSDDGSEANPWATIDKVNATVQAGDNVIVEDGTYSGSGFKRLTWACSGTSGAHILIRARNRRMVTIDGEANGSTDDDVYFLNANGSYSYIDWDGIIWTNFAMIQNGVFTLSNQSGGSIAGWSFKHGALETVPPGDPSAQGIYMGEGFVGLTVDDFDFNGSYPDGAITGGAAVSAYADDGAGPRDVVVSNFRVNGWYTGIQIYDDETNASITDGEFTGCQTNVDLSHHAAVYLANLTGDHGDGADIYDPNNADQTTDGGGIAFT